MPTAFLGCVWIASAGLTASRPAVGLQPSAASRFRAPFTVAPTVAVVEPLQRAPLLKTWEALSSEHYLAFACVQSCLLRGGSDAMAQVMRGGAIDVSHSAAFATMGLLYSGLLGALWLRTLEAKLGDGTDMGDVAKKTAADYLLYAPLANSAYLFFVPFLTGLYSQHVGGPADLSQITSASMASWQNGFGSAMQLEASMFAPYNMFSFRLIPANVRPQATAAMCAGYTVIMSGLC
jgi:hypothetical protein